MNKLIKRSIAFSFFLHSALVGSVIYFSPQLQLKLERLFNEQKQTGFGNNENFDGFYKPSPIQVEIVEVKGQKRPPSLADGIGANSSKENEIKEFLEPSDICKEESSFGGIGLSFAADSKDPMFSIVTAAPGYYPAYGAGIRVGDKVLNNAIPMIKGQVGSVVTVNYLRNNEQKSVSITRAKICFKKKV